MAREVALLAEVQRKLRDGQAEEALEMIEQNETGFARSQLRTELEAVRVLASCGLGQTAAARRAALRFLQSHLASPLVERIRRECGLSAPGTEASPSGTTGAFRDTTEMDLERNHH